MFAINPIEVFTLFNNLFVARIKAKVIRRIERQIFIFLLKDFCLTQIRILFMTQSLTILTILQLKIKSIYSDTGSSIIDTTYLQTNSSSVLMTNLIVNLALTCLNNSCKGAPSDSIRVYMFHFTTHFLFYSPTLIFYCFLKGFTIA